MRGLSKYVGIPWSDDGCDERGASCWGLLVLVLGDVGVKVSMRDGQALTDQDRLEIAGLGGDWLPVVGQVQLLDGLLFDMPDGWHVGLVAKPGLMLHATKGGPSGFHRYDTSYYRQFLTGIYRRTEFA